MTAKEEWERSVHALYFISRADNIFSRLQLFHPLDKHHNSETLETRCRLENLQEDEISAL